MRSLRIPFIAVVLGSLLTASTSRATPAPKPVADPARYIEGILMNVGDLGPGTALEFEGVSQKEAEGLVSQAQAAFYSPPERKVRILVAGSKSLSKTPHLWARPIQPAGYAYVPPWPFL